MPDITMCIGEGFYKHPKAVGLLCCPKRDTCYRYKANANPNWQSYFSFLPFNIETETCDAYEEMKQSDA